MIVKHVEEKVKKGEVILKTDTYQYRFSDATYSIDKAPPWHWADYDETIIKVRTPGYKQQTLSFPHQSYVVS